MQYMIVLASVSQKSLILYIYFTQNLIHVFNSQTLKTIEYSLFCHTDLNSESQSSLYTFTAWTTKCFLLFWSECFYSQLWNWKHNWIFIWTMWRERNNSWTYKYERRMWQEEIDSSTCKCEKRSQREEKKSILQLANMKKELKVEDWWRRCCHQLLRQLNDKCCYQSLKKSWTIKIYQKSQWLLLISILCTQ